VSSHREVESRARIAGAAILGQIGGQLNRSSRRRSIGPPDLRACAWRSLVSCAALPMVSGDEIATVSDALNFAESAEKPRFQA
jgi:hypothetical protein